VLSPYRVLDLTDNRAALGPMLLADLGADVIKVEPPGGADARRDAPLAPGLDDAMASLAFHAYNRNKRSVEIDLDAPAGREAFLGLVASADFLFENDAPGAMAARGLGFDDLVRVNPRLVYVATTPFGQDGPYAKSLATDLTLAAMGGMMALNGDADRAPVRVSVPQTWHHAAVESAAGALVAHHLRERTGEGRFVDVSVQTAVFWTGLQAMIAHAVQGKDMERAGTLLQLGPLTLQIVFPCTDGLVVLLANGATMPTLVPWMVDEGVVPESWLADEDWPQFDLNFLSGKPTAHTYDEVVERIATWIAKYSKQELLERGLAAKVTIVPVTTVADVLAFGHLQERDFWRAHELAPGRTLRAPGPFVKSTTKAPAVLRGTPRPGEHTAEVLAEPARRPRAVSPRDGLPMEGLKVADFAWIGVGPISGKYLADHGANVVRVESASPPDRLRVVGPFAGGVPGPNRSQFFGAFNTSKRSISLSLKHPAAREIAKKLIAWADVVIESFTPGTMADLGLGYDVAKQINPSVIYASTCLMGQTGPAAPLAGYGYHAAAISGFYEITGWPDRPPSGPFTAYTDTIAPRFLATALLAAIDHRNRTGEGQHIEQAQMESALYFLAPELLDYQVSGAIPTRAGNDSPTAAPHGAYPCAGEDEWCAIAVETEAQWRALQSLLCDQPWVMEPAYATLEGRLALRREIDEHLSRWTRPQEPLAVMARLQAAGVPAGFVQRSSDLLHDPQLAHRNFFRPLEHPEMGMVPYEGHQFRISGYDSGPRSPAPCLGEHSVEILTEELGLSDDELGELLASGAVG
jgi:crotonobetainyl-CoA:carnitine CoA-transferase CaiB-like acyl-CoA transferase